MRLVASSFAFTVTGTAAGNWLPPGDVGGEALPRRAAPSARLAESRIAMGA